MNATRARQTPGAAEPPTVTSGPQAPDSALRTRFGGLFDRRPRWAPTWRGWVIVVLLLIGGAYATLRTVHPFLAVQAPLSADVLVIEGWIPEYAVAEVADDIRAGRYQYVFTVGGPVTGVLPPAADDDTHAYVAAKLLQRLGLPGDAIQMVPTPTVGRDRTYHSAHTLKVWLQNHGIVTQQVNVVTLGVHARRSRLLFEKALGPDIDVGIISIRHREYEPEHWWRYSEGVKEVLSEGAAYLYARFLFRPEK